MTVSLSNTNSDIVLSPSSLTFKTSNFLVWQTVTVSASQDNDYMDETDTITVSASGGRYDKAPSITKAVSITDDEPGFDITPASLDLTEGGQATFKLRLREQPSADMRVLFSMENQDGTTPDHLTLDADPNTEGNQITLVFARTGQENAWNQYRTIVVSAGHDDDSLDESLRISLSVEEGDDLILNAMRLPVTVTDDDDGLTPSGTIQISPAGDLDIAEGGSKSFTVHLSSAPNADVTVSLSKTNPDIALSPDSLTFTASNHSTAQAVTVSAPQDDDAMSESDTIVLTATGGIVAPQAMKTVTVADDDASSGTIITSPAGVLTVAEGGSAGISVQLSTAPNADVVVTLSMTDEAISLDKTSLTFTASNWNQAQSVVVSTLADTDIDDERVDISLIAVGGINAPESVVTVVVDDANLTGGLSLSPRMLEVTGGDSATLSVSLASKPSTAGIVQVFLSKTDLNLSLEPASLTFDDSNWNQVQSVILNAAVHASEGSDTLTLGVRGEGNYASVEDTTLPVRILEAPGAFSLSPESTSVAEGGSAAQLEARLQIRPLESASVTITFTADRSGVEISPSTLIFPADGWDTPRSVAVRAVDDVNALDETVNITAIAVGGNYRSVQRSATVMVQDDDDGSTPLPPVRSQVLALPQTSAQDSAVIRVRCVQDSPCHVVLDCHAQADGSAFEASLPEPIPAWGSLTLEAEDIERLTGASWTGKGRLGCALRSEEGLSAQVWTLSGDGVLVNNSAFIRSVPEGTMHRADIESIPTPVVGPESTNIRIRCLAPLESDCDPVNFACYDDAGMRYDGRIGAIERLNVHHLQTAELAHLIDHRWQGMGLGCEVRSSAPFTVQVLTRTGGGGALVNNSATGTQ